MDFRACLAATLLAAAALMANAQPAGSRDPAALRSRADGSPPRRTFDFVIQKAEVRELSSSQLFLRRRQPPDTERRATVQGCPRPSATPLGSRARGPRAEAPAEEATSAKAKPTSKPRGGGGDTRRCCSPSPPASRAKAGTLRQTRLPPPQEQLPLAAPP
ncbi:Protein of unknown function [Gryllus bimaculatus]|nr:Protein of unknown function [Gryllus bimaculatus]